VLICSDFGYELSGTDCVAASWFNASVPVTTCEVGKIYHNSSGSVPPLLASTTSSEGVNGGTAAAAPPPFRLGDPALCGSHPLVTP